MLLDVIHALTPCLCRWHPSSCSPCTCAVQCRHTASSSTRQPSQIWPLPLSGPSCWRDMILSPDPTLCAWRARENQALARPRKEGGLRLPWEWWRLIINSQDTMQQPYFSAGEDIVDGYLSQVSCFFVSQLVTLSRPHLFYSLHFLQCRLQTEYYEAKSRCQFTLVSFFFFIYLGGELLTCCMRQWVNKYVAFGWVVIEYRKC